jgi:hypothetical protein
LPRKGLVLVMELVLGHTWGCQNGKIQRDLIQNPGSFGKSLGVLEAKQVALQSQHALWRLLDEIQNGQQLADGMRHWGVEHEHAIGGLEGADAGKH